MTNHKPAVTPPPQLVLFIGILAVSTASIFIRMGQSEAPSLVIAALRLGIASLILTPYLMIKKRAELRKIPKHTLLQLSISGFFLALHFAAWISSLEFTTVASSVVLVTTTPIWVALASPLFLKEKPGKAILIGLLLAMAGSIITGLADSCMLSSFQVSCAFDGRLFAGKQMLGNLLALAGAVFAAAYLVIGRKVRGQVDAFVYIYVVYTFAALFLLTSVFTLQLPIAGYSSNFYLIAFLLALFPQVIGHSTYNWALGYLPATFVSIALLGEPIGTIILSFLLLKESPTPLEWIGGIMLLGGILISAQTKNLPVEPAN